jgi:hypothetical protein
MRRMAMDKLRVLEGILDLIRTHNDGVQRFRSFCEAQEKESGYPFSPMYWKVYQYIPMFARHADLLIKEAAAVGINAKCDEESCEIIICGAVKEVAVFDVILYEDNEYAVLHTYANGEVLGLRLPVTDRGPDGELGAWRMRLFNPKGE